MKPKVFIIVLNWNGCSDTVECVESLKKIVYPSCEIILVDNGSTDGSEEILRKKFPETLFIQTGENLGYAGGNNIGMKYALSLGADFVILLNNDTVVAPDFVAELVNAAESGSSIGIAGSKVYYYDKPDFISYGGGFINLRTGWSRNACCNEKDEGQCDSLKEIDWAPGCAMMVSRSVCEKTGFMNPEYFCYYEEIDWCIRAKKAGFKVVLAPKSRIWHKVFAATGGAGSGMFLYYTLRNSLKCINDNAAYRFGLLNHLRNAFLIALNFAGMFSRNVPLHRGIKMICRASRDYYKGRFGKYAGAL